MHPTNVDERPQTFGKTDIYTHSTGTLASQLLNPKVPAEELLEYYR